MPSAYSQYYLKFSLDGRKVVVGAESALSLGVAPNERCCVLPKE